MPSHSNRVIISAAGSRKTQRIIDSALADPGKRVLITTYTIENQQQVVRRIQERAGGVVPQHIDVMGWFEFLIGQCARPYQSAVFNRIDYVGSLNFHGRRSRYTRKDDVHRYFLDRRRSLYRDGISELACLVNDRSSGRVIRRLEGLYDYIYIDEVQDFNGYDLEFLDLTFRSSIGVMVVGDPRQWAYMTNQSNKNKRYRGSRMIDYFRERETKGLCAIEECTDCWRSNQAICNWADALYPGFSPTVSMNNATTGHDGVFFVAKEDIPTYVEKFGAVVLRHDRRTDTLEIGRAHV